MYFDTHTHLNSPKLYRHLEQHIANAHQKGVNHMIVVGYDEETSKLAIEIAQTHPGIYAAVGIHPSDLLKANKGYYERIETLLSSPCVVALGEVGLDYYWKEVEPIVQVEAFRRWIQLAKKIKKPLIIHSRDAIEETYRILKEEGAQEVGGIMHCYSSSVEMAHKFLDLGFHISLGGPVTFLNAKQPKEVSKMVPLSKLLIETDCPYLTPHPFRGTLNEPAMVPLVAQEIASLRNMGVDDLAKATTTNALALFQIHEED